MKPCIIYHSYSGNTRSIAESVQSSCGGDLIEVKLTEGHSSPVAYLLGLFRSLRKRNDPVEPASIDVSATDVVVIGTPVWARKATPAILSAVAGLKGCSGKKAVIFATCGSVAGDALPELARQLEAKGMTVTGRLVFTRHDLCSEEKLTALTDCVTRTGRAL